MRIAQQGNFPCKATTSFGQPFEGRVGLSFLANRAPYSFREDGSLLGKRPFAHYDALGVRGDLKAGPHGEG